jgi:hypothetical protein
MFIHPSESTMSSTTGATHTQTLETCPDYCDNPDRITLRDCRSSKETAEKHFSHAEPAIRQPRVGEKYKLTGQRDEINCIVKEIYDDFDNLTEQVFHPCLKMLEGDVGLTVHRVLFSGCISSDGNHFIRPEILSETIWHYFEHTIESELSENIISHGDESICDILIDADNSHYEKFGVPQSYQKARTLK